jgi:succinyl-diaminopimelate desuccinylase
VPDVVTLRIDRRIIPEENPPRSSRTLVDHIERVCAGHAGHQGRHPPHPAGRAVHAAPGPGEADRPAAESTVRRSWARRSRPNGVPIYTDARLYSAAGIPTVLYGAGPHSLLDANGHRADEKLVLEDLRKATQVVALTLADLLA